MEGEPEITMKKHPPLEKTLTLLTWGRVRAAPFILKAVDAKGGSVFTRISVSFLGLESFDLRNQQLQEILTWVHYQATQRFSCYLINMSKMR
jgi:hypothetical protein